MSVDMRVMKATAMIREQIEELSSIYEEVEQDNDFEFAKERLRRWKTRTENLLSEQVNPNESKNLEKIPSWEVYEEDSLGDAVYPFDTLSAIVEMYRVFLLTLKDELEKHPEDILSDSLKEDISSSPAKEPPTTASRAVFIVHGKDELNRRRLETLLQKHWNLEAIVLSYEPGKGRTLIEKFEQEAQRATYAIVLFTPDDQVKIPDIDEYAQARPNAVFELGWFCGSLGRSKVCILCKKGTKIHSDLDGINRIDFKDSVEEKVLDIERELKEVGLINK